MRVGNFISGTFSLIVIESETTLPTISCQSISGWSTGFRKIFPISKFGVLDDVAISFKYFTVVFT